VSEAHYFLLCSFSILVFRIIYTFKLKLFIELKYNYLRKSVEIKMYINIFPFKKFYELFEDLIGLISKKLIKIHDYSSKFE